MKKLIISAAVFGFLMFGASDVFACSCMANTKLSKVEQIQNAYQTATVVFYGEAIEVKREKIKNEKFGEMEFVIVKFKVEKSWKGQKTDRIVVRTATSSAACGFNFESGRKYLVYATPASGGGLRTTNCSRTSASGVDAKYLNKIKKPKLFAGNNK